MNEPSQYGFNEDEELLGEIETEDFWIELPDQYELCEKRIMGDFMETYVQRNVSNRLFQILCGQHPCRYFKDAIHETGISQKYYDLGDRGFLKWLKNGARNTK